MGDPGDLARLAPMVWALPVKGTEAWLEPINAAYAQKKRIAETFNPGPGDGLRLNARNAADRQKYLEMVRREMLRSPSFYALMVAMNADRAHPVEVTLGRNRPGVFIDSFDSKFGVGQQEIDLADIEKLPVDPPAEYPDAATQGEMLAHSMAEARQGALGHEYGEAHRAGIKAQNDFRDDHNQHGHRRLPPNDTNGTNAAGNYDVSYDNKYIETWVRSQNNITDIQRFK